jgi:cell division protein FtsB
MNDCQKVSQGRQMYVPVEYVELVIMLLCFIVVSVSFAALPESIRKGDMGYGTLGVLLLFLVTLLIYFLHIAWAGVVRRRDQRQAPKLQAEIDRLHAACGEVETDNAALAAQVRELQAEIDRQHRHLATSVEIRIKISRNNGVLQGRCEVLRDTNRYLLNRMRGLVGRPDLTAEVRRQILFLCDKSQPPRRQARF